MPASPSSPHAGTQEAAWPEDAVEVGRVLGAWGVKGWIKLQSFVADVQTLCATPFWLVGPPEGGVPSPPAAAPAPLPSRLHVAQAREHGGLVVAQVDGVSDRTRAESLRGLRLFLARSQFPAPKAGEYYWVDLIGLSVMNRQGQAMGVVAGLIDTGPHSVLRLTKPEGESTLDGAERLIPFVAAYVDDVDLAKRSITVDWELDY